ncbi:Uma2 family endonuclease [Ancylothrix sp. C2]|uniref:Uma2 family endonuclease n=1 Tax=Ancylothrix sp. D3o TaxID=2953691 RepID=UPI0021BB72B0|nr:Uma2 family endonuclease [Ancylothrix sp. D3o]MCT7950419.1 Uma2 family endonuclease [Ancylothrix sp. D3o]
MVISSQSDLPALPPTDLWSEELPFELPPESSLPPTDLWSEEPPLESYRHLKQLLLFLSCLERLWQDRNDFFAAANMSVYYSLKQLKSRDFRGPDFFVVLGTERRERKSWTVWEEDGKYPDFIVEILSESTAANDRGIKKQIYQDIWHTSEYFFFEPYKLQFEGYKLLNGKYEEIVPNERGWRWSEQLQLFLGVFEEKLRFFTPDGVLVPTPEEAEVQERRRAEQAEMRTEQAEAQAAKLLRKLQELGVNVEEL